MKSSPIFKLALIFTFSGLLSFLSVSCLRNARDVSNSAFPNDSVARTAIQRFTEANDNNDFATLASSFAPYVERYHEVRNITRDSVVTYYRNYDELFNVHSKNSKIRWNTFEVTPIDHNSASVVYVEEYTVAREDRTKPTYYLLEKHLVINSNYQIVSIYDKVLEHH